MGVVIALTTTSTYPNPGNHIYYKVPTDNHLHRHLLTNLLVRKKKSIEQPREVLPAGMRDTDFFTRVYEVVRLVPKGRVTTYGAIARFLGSGKSARMVGWAMNACHQVKPPVPAHRVVNRNGQLSGKMHFGEPDRMEQLLKKEKINVSKDTIVNFEQLLWDPQQEIELF